MKAEREMEEIDAERVDADAKFRQYQKQEKQQQAQIKAMQDELD